MDICRHTGKRCHGFTLASGCDQNYLLIRIVLHLVDLDQCLIRDTEVSKFCCSCDNIYHTAAFYCNLTSETVCSIDDLLYTVYVRRKSRDNDSVCLIFIKKIIKYMTDRTLGHSEAASFSVGTVTHQCQYTFLTNLSETLQVDRISKYRCVIYFEVTGVNNDTSR